MKAMILAAGFGTRLGNLTDKRPKCLMEVGGDCILGHVIKRLKSYGVTYIVINLHYLGDMVKEYIDANNKFDIEIEFSEEHTLLGTGGGVLNAKHYLEDVDNFILHNSDIYSDVHIREMYEQHVKSNAVATLGVQQRETTRPLMFDSSMRLAGWESKRTGRGERFGTDPLTSPYGFTGIHVVSSKIFDYMNSEEEAFSIITPYLDASKSGESVFGYDATGKYWIDIGKPERLFELKELLSPSEHMI